MCVATWILNWWHWWVEQVYSWNHCNEQEIEDKGTWSFLPRLCSLCGKFFTMSLSHGVTSVELSVRTSRYSEFSPVFCPSPLPCSGNRNCSVLSRCQDCRLLPGPGVHLSVTWLWQENNTDKHSSYCLPTGMKSKSPLDNWTTKATNLNSICTSHWFLPPFFLFVYFLLF